LVGASLAVMTIAETAGSVTVGKSVADDIAPLPAAARTLLRWQWL
jgi:hypothetical protein